MNNLIIQYVLTFCLIFNTNIVFTWYSGFLGGHRVPTFYWFYINTLIFVQISDIFGLLILILC